MMLAAVASGEKKKKQKTKSAVGALACAAGWLSTIE